MSKINQLQSVNIRELQGGSKTSVTKSLEKKETGDAKDFGDTIGDFIKAVNDSQKTAAQEVTDIIQGRSQNLHQAMATLEEAKLSFQLMIEIRNKLLESYQELQRMQV
ncbi:MAG: flagellar hook-basal body complex protein FliE [Calditrichaeota bacterium]|nr:flagellar hook-basal body complex protein FliE [Calditrichota bacterium]